MIWYAGYGSNLSRDRFARYVAGCRDRTAPARATALNFPGRLSFAGESEYLLGAPGVDLVWGRDSIAALEHPDAVRG